MKIEEKRTALSNVDVCRNGQCKLRVSSDGDDANSPLTFVLISSDNDGLRRDWYTGEKYIERLDISGATYDNLRTFFKDHDASVDTAIGKVQNVRIEGDELVGEVIFGTGADEQSVRRKYVEGVLTDVSVRYVIKEHTIEEREGKPDLVTINKFDIVELSAVGIGFDSGAKKRTKYDEELEARVGELEKYFKG